MLSNIIIYDAKAFPFANNATIMQSTRMIYDLYLWFNARHCYAHNGVKSNRTEP